MKTVAEIIDMVEAYAEQRRQGVDAHGILVDIERAIKEREGHVRLEMLYQYAGRQA